MIDQIRVGGDPGRQLSPAEFSLEQRAAWVLASDGAGAVATADLVEASAAPPVDGKQWFVAFTSPKREPSVAKAARQRAFASYVPTQLVSRTVSRRRVTVGSPLLPRYVFVGLEEGQGFYGLRGTPGLEGLVRMAGSIVRVQPEVLHGLHARQLAGEFEFTDDALAADEMERLQEEHRAFEPGESVMLMVGPFKGFGAIVIAALFRQNFFSRTHKRV